MWKVLIVSLAVFGWSLAINGQTPLPSPSTNGATLIIDDVREGDVFGFGRSVEIRGIVKLGVVAFGGDVTVKGRVEGDVASIGGSVFQQDGSFIGGDVIVIGGSYHKEGPNAERNPSKATIMYAGFEDELRQLMREPTSLLVPRWSTAYVGQRLLAILFWFMVSLAVTAATPGAVSRGISRLNLTRLRVAFIGLLSSIGITLSVLLGASLLPASIGTLLGVTALLLVVVSYLFGRVIIHAATGRWLQRRFLSEGKRSESVALLLGTAVWSVLLSLPFVWPFLVAGLLVTSMGLAFTARHRMGHGWRG